MRITGVLRVTLGLMLPFTIALAACSSDDGGGPAEAGGAPAATASPAGDQAEAEAKVSQTLDMSIEVTSPVFNRIRRIPKTYVCPGGAPQAGQSFEQNPEKYIGRENVSPPLEWTGIPEGTKSIALLMDSDQIAHDADPDARWTHWLIWNIPADATGLPERVASTTQVAAIGPDVRQGTSDDDVVGYFGPCPVPTTVQYSQTKLKLVFEYLFHVYALDTVLDLPAGATRGEFVQAIDGHILASGVIKGEFVGSKQMN